VCQAQFPTADLRPSCALAGLYSCIELIERHDVAHVEGMGMAELKAAEDWPVLWPMCAGVEAAEEAAGGSRRRCPASTRVLRCCVQPGRATIAGTT